MGRGRKGKGGSGGATGRDRKPGKSGRPRKRKSRALAPDVKAQRNADRKAATVARNAKKAEDRKAASAARRAAKKKEREEKKAAEKAAKGPSKRELQRLAKQERAREWLKQGGTEGELARKQEKNLARAAAKKEKTAAAKAAREAAPKPEAVQKPTAVAVRAAKKRSGDTVELTDPAYKAASKASSKSATKAPAPTAPKAPSAPNTFASASAQAQKLDAAYQTRLAQIPAKDHAARVALHSQYRADRLPLLRGLSVDDARKLGSGVSAPTPPPASPVASRLRRNG